MTEFLKDWAAKIGERWMKENTITPAELQEALANVPVIVDVNTRGRYERHATLVHCPVAYADDLLKYIQEHREPEYEPGRAYVDANGTVWLRSCTGDGWWLFGNHNRFSHQSPTRPLYKLVPEEK